MREPEYYVSIERVDTEQKLFTGYVKGPIVPLIEGCILEHARVTDAGKRLSARHERRAYNHVR